MKQTKPLQLIIQDQSRLDQLLKDHMSRTSKIQSRQVSVYTEYILENPKKVTNQRLSVYRDMRPRYAKLFMKQWKYIVIQKSMNPYSDNVMSPIPTMITSLETFVSCGTYKRNYKIRAMDLWSHGLFVFVLKEVFL